MVNQSTFDFVLMFTAETDDRLYQLRQWIKPLERLASRSSVAVVTVNKSAFQLLEKTKLNHFFYENLEASATLVSDLSPKVMLYVSKGINTLKFTGNRNSLHVYIGHGESDKGYSADNTMKYFDYILLSGPLGLKRIVENVSDFPVEARCRVIGRPQHLDPMPAAPTEFKKAKSKTTIIYTPTADFLSPINRYGTAATHGIEFVRQILKQSDKYQLLYKPHPLVGSRIPENKAANETIIRMIEEANGDHFHDTGAFGWQLGSADVMVTDISAVAYDWLATGKPLLVTLASTPGVEIYKSGILGDLELVPEAKASEICDLIEDARANSQVRSKLEFWRTEYFAAPVDEESGEEKFTKEMLVILEHARNLEQSIESAPKSAEAKTTGNQSRRTSENWIQKTLKSMFVWISNAKKPTTEQWVAHFYEQKLNLDLVKELFTQKRTTLLISGYRNFLDALIWKVKNFSSLKNLQIRYTPGRRHVSTAIGRVKPEVIFYLTHGPKNHYSIRASGIQHHLYKPDLQRRFSVDHNLAAYDQVTVARDETFTQVEKTVFIPEGWAKKLSVSMH